MNCCADSRRECYCRAGCQCCCAGCICDEWGDDERELDRLERDVFDEEDTTW